MQAIFDGNFRNALLINPLGFIALLVLFIVPLWISTDWFTRKSSFQDFYHQVEFYLSNKRISLPILGLVILNWIWNINKGL
jgi:hypothetical protein